MVKCKILENRIFLKIIDFKKWNKKKKRKRFPVFQKCFKDYTCEMIVYNKLIVIFI